MTVAHPWSVFALILWLTHPWSVCALILWLTHPWSVHKLILWLIHPWSVYKLILWQWPTPGLCLRTDIITVTHPWSVFCRYFPRSLPGNITNDNSLLANTAVIKMTTGLRDIDLVYVTFHNKVSPNMVSYIHLLYFLPLLTSNMITQSLWIL